MGITERRILQSSKKIMTRAGILVKLGRVYQNISPIFGIIDISFRTKPKKDVHPIFILAPPRSGSTITYQILSTALSCTYLSNLNNLLFATPALGFKLSSKKCNNHISSFKSERGFVDGLCGEAEGLKFWNYWGGCDIIESKVNNNISQLNKLKNVLNSLEYPFLSGFLGHVFSLEILYKIFPNALFIHLKRDLLSNAYSLTQFRQIISGTSSLPDNIDMTLPKEEQVVAQIMEIHNRIEKFQNDFKPNFISLEYEKICQNPNSTIERILDYCNKINFKLEASDEISNIPKSFKVSKRGIDDNATTRLISSILKNRI